MLDSSGLAILIDFDSCEKEGGPRGGGTPGYIKDWADRIAKKEWDLYALECLETYLRTGRTNVGFWGKKEDCECNLLAEGELVTSPRTLTTPRFAWSRQGDLKRRLKSLRKPKKGTLGRLRLALRVWRRSEKRASIV
jgi:hypothetical protein